MNDEPVWKRAINKARQQLAGLIGRGKIRPEKSPAGSLSTRSALNSQEQLPDSIATLPTELVEEIGTLMVTDDVRETARGIRNLRLVSPRINSVVESSPKLTRVRQRIADLRSLTNDHHATVVKEELPSVQSETHGPPLEQEPVPAVAHVRAVAANLKLRSSKENSVLVTKILAIQDSVARSETIQAMGPYFDNIAEDDRSRLIKEAINIFGDRGHPLTKEDFDTFQAEGYPINLEGRREAADVIVESKARGYLTNEHQSDILDLTTSWPELSGVLAQSEENRRKSVRTQIRMFGPDVVAADVLNSDNSGLKAIQTFQMTRYFKEIDPKTLSGLIDNAITTFGQVNIPFEKGGRTQAVDVIVEARAGGYLTEEHKLSLNRLTRDNQELEEILSERMESNKKYIIDRASDAEVANLRESFKKVENIGVPQIDPGRLSAEHARMASLKKISNSLEKLSTMLRQELSGTDRNRANLER